MRLMPITRRRPRCPPGMRPEMMRPIGGPHPEAEVRVAHQRRLSLMERGKARLYRNFAENSAEVLGTIGIWKIDWAGPQTYEMGWFVLPEHQGQGVATAAARLLIAEVRSIHAYPTVANAASNVIARELGMENQGEFDNEGFAGVLRCHDWQIDIR